ncbi:MAG TPA: ATP-binding protein [Elusimicrobiota bacterium]|nr:ATP-binding protein [Elusimicrobiota bacterium]
MSEKVINILLLAGDAGESAVIGRALADTADGEGAFAVKDAGRLDDGCRLLERERFDAVLLDLRLDSSAGGAGLRQVRAQAPETPILILAGLQDEPAAAAAVRDGAMDCVIKGSPDGMLKRAIRHAVERRSLTREVERLRSADAAAKRLEAEARENLRIVEIKNQFMGRISHELRNTLATVKTAVFCLNDALTGPLAPRQAQLVEMISRNVDRQVKIIDNILDLARFQSGKLKIVPRSVDLASLVDEAAQEFRMKSKAPRLDLEVPGELPAVHGDADLLAQVLRNLMDNACRFARARVAVKAVDAGLAGVQLSVVDDGAGIPQGRIGELFDQFVQLDRPKGGEGYKGTGLGLAICREIVEGHRGRIWAESVEGDGATFHVILPKCAEAGAEADGARGAQAARARPPAACAGRGRGRTSHPGQK